MNSVGNLLSETAKTFHAAQSMTPDQKTKIDTATEPALWQMLTSPPLDPEVAAYIRDTLSKRSRTETLKRLEELSGRLRAVEYAQERSSLGTPTFWLALLAAVFASFSVPWEEVKQELKKWGVEMGASRRQASTWKSPGGGGQERYREPLLPEEDPTSPLADALLLLPRTDVRPQSFPGL